MPSYRKVQWVGDSEGITLSPKTKDRLDVSVGDYVVLDETGEDVTILPAPTPEDWKEIVEDLD